MDAMTAEELELCFPYSEAEMWERLPISHFAQGRSRLRGRPGLREKVEWQFSCFMARDLASLCLDLMTSHEGRWLDSGAYLTSEGGPVARGVAPCSSCSARLTPPDAVRPRCMLAMERVTFSSCGRSGRPSGH